MTPYSGVITASDASKAESGVWTPLGLRRWTPVERERLQGFPDNWTAVPWRGATPEKAPETFRGAAVGNSMAVPVIRWLGERIGADAARVGGRMAA